MSARDAASPVMPWHHRPWSLLGVLAVALYLFPYSRSLNNPNERTRVLQARAIVEHGQLHIGQSVRDARGGLWVEDLYGTRHRGPFVNDMALVCEDTALEPPRCAGKLYPAKAPGAALLGVPALALAEAVGFIPDGDAGEPRATWVLRYGGIAVWFLLGLWVLGRELGRAGAHPRFVARAVLASGLGTSAFPYAIAVVGHTLAGVALLFGLVLARDADEHKGPTRSQLWAAAAGTATGWAVLLEYHAALAVLAVCAWMLSPRRRRLIVGFGLGGLASFALHAWLHSAMFRSPFKTGHFYLMTAHNRNSQAKGFLGLDGFHPDALLAHLFDLYMGLAPIMPWLLLGAVLAVRALWSERGVDNHSSVDSVARGAAAVCLAYLAFVSFLGNFAEMNGWSIGPRYLTPALVPWSLVAARGWWWAAQRAPRWARVCAGLAGASAVITVAITAAYPSPPNKLRNVFAELAFDLLRAGYGVRNVAMALGPTSLLALALAVLVLAGWIVLGEDLSHPQRHVRQRLASAALGAAVAAGYCTWLANETRAQPAARAQAVAFCKRTLEGVAPDHSRTFFE